MQTIEIKFHTPEAVREYLKEAGEILDEQGYTGEEKLALLPTIIGMLASKNVQLAQQAPMSLGLPAMAIPRSRSGR